MIANRSSSSRPVNLNISPSSSTSTAPQYLVETVLRLQEAVADLRAALDYANIPSLFATGAAGLRDRYTEVGALLVQLHAMRAQLAEYVHAAEDEAGAGAQGH